MSLRRDSSGSARGLPRRAEELPATLAVFPLDGALLLPGSVLPLQIFEPRYLNMVDDVMAGGRLIGMVQTRPGGPTTKPRLARVGCAGRITRYSETGDGRYMIGLTGLCRFAVGEEVAALTPYRQVQADFAAYAADLEEPEETLVFDRSGFTALLRRYLERRGLGIEWDAVEAAAPIALINSLCMALPFQVVEKQALLEAHAVEDRRDMLRALLTIDAAGPSLSGEDEEAPPLQ